MLEICKTYPGELWLSLGWRFLKTDHDNFMDIPSKYISIDNQFTILNWEVKEWKGKDLLKIVGYTDKGSKMSTLRNKYVNEVEFNHMKKIIKRNMSKSYFAIGMNLNMETTEVGGCLSSFHIIKNKKEFEVFVYGKVVAFPKKFTADMVLFGNLIRELNLPVKTLRVNFKISSFYFEPIFMRAFIPIYNLDKETIEKFSLNQTPNFRTSWKKVEEYAKTITRRPAWENLNTQKGMWKR